MGVGTANLVGGTSAWIGQLLDCPKCNNTRHTTKYLDILRNFFAFLEVSGNFLHFSENPDFCAQKGTFRAFCISHHFGPFKEFFRILKKILSTQNHMLHSMSSVVSFVGFFVVLHWTV